MAQISYGTITITDTTDLEFTIEYARNQSTSTPPAQSSSDWNTTRPAWAQGYYIWQRTRIHKYGTAESEDTFSTAICVSGSAGATGQSLTATKTQYTHVASNVTITTQNHTSYTWTDNVPEYDSTKPAYWGRITNTYINPAKTEYIVYKDNGITESIGKAVAAEANAATALSISQHANEDSQGAMAQAASNVSEIKRIWYAQSAATPTPAAPTTGITTTAAHDAWSITKPAPNNDYQYYFYCDQTKTGGGVYSWSEVILDTSNLSQYQIGALTSKVKNFWWDSSGAHVASGKNGNEVTTNTISTYGYHALMGLTGINFNYDGAKVVDLNSTTPSLDFYQPPTISGSTVTQGKKTMMLSANALKFYNPTNGTTEQAVLDSNGLLLKEGGIKSGSVNAGNSGFIYLSTKNYGSNLTINGHQASNWREVIGTKFGVDADGNLYASNADISGKITVGSGSNVYTTDDVNPLEIGGRNLVLNSKHLKTWRVGTNASFTTDGEYRYVTLNGTTTNWSSQVDIYPTRDLGLLDGSSLLLSFEYKASANWQTNNIICAGTASAVGAVGTSAFLVRTKYTSLISDSSTVLPATNEWKKATLSCRSLTPDMLTSGSGALNSWYIQIYNYHDNLNVDLRKIKLEKGNIATDWTPAPEDTKSTHTLTASNTQGATYATILGYAAEGTSTNFTVTSTAGVNVGDTVRIAYKANDMGTSGTIVYIIGTVTDVNNSTNLRITAHGLDSTVIDGGHILTGTIDASKVNVTNLNANNISGGTLNINYIPADARNSNISIGGENLLKDNSCLYLTSYNCAILKLTENLVAGQTYTLQLWGVYFTNTPNTNNFIGVYLGGGNQNLGSITSFYYGYGYLTFTATEANIAHADSRRGFIYLYNTTPLDSKTSRQITITKWKLEKGNKPTDWSPAPSDRAGNANLLRGTMQMLDGVGSYASGTFRASGGTLSHGNFGAGSEIPVNGLTGFIRTQNYTSSATNVGIAQDGIPPVDIRTGTFFTLSCWVRGTAGVEVYLQPLWKSATQHAGNSPSAQRRILSGIWSFIQYTGVLVGDQITDGISGGYVYGYNVPVNGYVDICGLKLEVGSAASGWNTGIGSDMVTRIDDSGISVHPMGTIANRIEIDATSLRIIKDNVTRATYGSTITLQSANNTGYPRMAVSSTEAYFQTSANSWATMNASGFDIHQGGASVAFYGDNARIGKDGKERVIIDASGVGIYDKNNYRRATFDATGIRLYGTNYNYPTVDVNATSSGVYLDANNYSRITSSGLDVVKGGTNVANFSTSARIGKEASGHASIKSDGLHVWIGTESTATNEVAFFGSTARIGKSSTRHVEVKDGGMQVYQDSSNIMAHIGYGSGNAQSGTAIAPYFTFGTRIGSIGNYSLAEGYETTASGYASHAEGGRATANEASSHAEGYSTTANGVASHAEGYETIASGYASHAEGNGSTTASGIGSHAEGYGTTASGTASHAGGIGTIAKGSGQTAIGQYNEADTTSLFIVGKGSSNARSNAFVVKYNGSATLAGTLTQGSDRRLKEHISYLGDEAVKFIDGLKPAHYIKDGEKHVGFYAQDVKEVDEWDCMTGEMNGYMTLGYMELLAPMVAYIQKLEKRIKELEEDK